MIDWKTQNDESKPLPSNGDMFGHDNNSAHLGYAIGFSYKKTGVVMFSGFKWVKFKYTFLYNGTNAGVLLDTLQFALPSIAFGLTVTLYYSLSRAFGHGFGYTVGIMFLPFIFVLLLGVGRSRYTRPDKYRDKF